MSAEPVSDLVRSAEPAPVDRASTTGRTGTPTPEVAHVDLAGRITSVNEAWTSFCVTNGGDVDACGVGASWLDACESADADPWAALVGSAFFVATTGRARQPLVVRVPCHAPGSPRWFDIATESSFSPSGHCDGVRVSVERVIDSPGQEAAPSALPWPTVFTELLSTQLRAEPHGERLQTLLETVLGLTGATGGGIWYLRDPRDLASASPLPPMTSVSGRGPAAVLAGSWSGEPSSVLEGRVGSLVDHVLGTCEAVSTEGVSSRPRRAVANPEDEEIRSATAPINGSRTIPDTEVLAVPLILADDSLLGALVVATNSDDGPQVPRLSLPVLTRISAKSALALATARSQEELSGVMLLHEKDRIATALNDRVVRRLFDAALGLDRIAAGTRDPADRERVIQCADAIDEAITQIRLGFPTD